MSESGDKLTRQTVRTDSKILTQAHRQMHNKINKHYTEAKRQYFSNKFPSQDGDLKNR